MTQTSLGRKRVKIKDKMSKFIKVAMLAAAEVQLKKIKYNFLIHVHFFLFDTCYRLGFFYGQDGKERQDSGLRKRGYFM